MLLVVEHDGCTVNELHFTSGPIYIGRHAHSQVLLTGRAVSRQHAVLYANQDGKWMVEDLHSANKTYLNQEEINKAEIKTGDILAIADYTIEVNLGDDADNEHKEPPIHMEDTIVAALGPKIITRDLRTPHPPAIKLPGKRAKDFLRAVKAISQAKGLDNVVHALIQISRTQLNAFHAWVALRDEPKGPMLAYAGKQRTGVTVKLDQIKLKDKITEALETGHFILVSKASIQLKEEKIGSAIIVPVLSQSGCFGVIYVDNDVAYEHYSLAELDYLMLVAMHTAAILENF